jgi:hypothetical protein
VAIDVAAPLTRSHARPFARPWILRYPARLALGLLVAGSVVLRSLLALFHSTPYYLPDEYLYPALARSLATTGRPLIRGGEAHFPALLQPLLTAPFQLFEDPELAYRLTQVFDAAAMSLAAIPVYLLARRLRLSEWYALACAGLAVATPSMVYAGFMLADPVAYPLALTAIYLGVRALEAPTHRAQLAFLGCAGLATFTRTQYVVLPIAFALAALAVERRRAFSTYRATVAAIALAVVATIALGPGRVAGVYSAAAHVDLNIGSALAWAGRDLVLLAYSAGWVLVPGACVGLLVGRSRVERAYAWFVTFLACALVAEAGVIAAIDSERFQERYLIALVPLVPLAFGVYIRRGAPHARVSAAIAIALLLFSMRVPMSGYAAARGKDDSSFLTGVRQLGEWIGVANSALVVALAAAVLSVAAIGLPLRRRFAAPAGVALTALALGCVSVATYGFDRELAAAVRTGSLAPDVRWVDHTGVRDAALLMLPNSEPQRSWHQLFWNRSVSDVLLLGRKERLDGYATSRVRVGDDGQILVRGRAIRQPLLVQTYGSRAKFTNATKVASAAGFDLWRPRGAPRLSLLAEGWYEDGWLAWPAFVSLWPDARGRVDGTLTLRLGVPADFARTRLTLDGPDFNRTIVLSPGVPRTIRIPVSHNRLWTLELSTPRATYVGLRSVSVRALSPVFVRGVCCSRRAAHAAAA